MSFVGVLGLHRPSSNPSDALVPHTPLRPGVFRRESAHAVEGAELSLRLAREDERRRRARLPAGIVVHVVVHVVVVCVGGGGPALAVCACRGGRRRRAGWCREISGVHLLGRRGRGREERLQHVGCARGSRAGHAVGASGHQWQGVVRRKQRVYSSFFAPRDGFASSRGRAKCETLEIWKPTNEKADFFFLPGFTRALERPT